MLSQIEALAQKNQKQYRSKKNNKPTKPKKKTTSVIDIAILKSCCQKSCLSEVQINNNIISEADVTNMEGADILKAIGPIGEILEGKHETGFQIMIE